MAKLAKIRFYITADHHYGVYYIDTGETSIFEAATKAKWFVSGYEVGSGFPAAVEGLVEERPDCEIFRLNGEGLQALKRRLATIRG